MNVKFDQMQDNQVSLRAYRLCWNIEIIFYQHKFAIEQYATKQQIDNLQFVSIYYR